MALSTETASRPGTQAEAEAGSLREVLDLAYPVILTQLSTTAMGVVDSAMVGRLGATQLAAVGFGAIWLWTVFSFFNGMASGCTRMSVPPGRGHARSAAWRWSPCACRRQTSPTPSSST